MMNEEVRSIMSKRVTTVFPDQTVGEVLQIMQRKRLQQLPVIDAERRLVGIITSYDLWQHCQGQDEGCGEGALVESLMSRQVVKLAPKDKVGTAAELFMDRRFKTLPVVNLQGTLKGVVTAFDVIRYSFQKEYPQPILYAERML